MVQIILVIVGVIALFRKNILVTMKSELRRPKIYIFGVVTIILPIISTVFDLLLKEGIVVKILWWISIIIPIILVFFLKETKLSLIENPELKTGRSKIEKFVWITVGVVLLALIAYVFFNSYRMNIIEKERQEQELLREQKTQEEINSIWGELDTEIYKEEDEIISEPSVVFLSPTSEKIEILKKETSEEGFSIAMEDNSYLQLDAKDFFDSKKIKTFEKESSGILKFQLTDGKIIDFDSTKIYWGVLVFDGKTEPKELDISLFVNDETSEIDVKKLELEYNKIK